MKDSIKSYVALILFIAINIFLLIQIIKEGQPQSSGNDVRIEVAE
jgi:hypothetical protein